MRLFFAFVSLLLFASAVLAEENGSSTEAPGFFSSGLNYLNGFMGYIEGTLYATSAYISDVFTFYNQKCIYTCPNPGKIFN